MDVGQILKSGLLEKFAASANFKTVDEYLAAVGFGDHSAESIVERVRAELSREGPDLSGAGAPLVVPRQWDHTDARGVRTAEGHDMLFRLSRCCAPVPGDAIVGYVTRGRGLTIHRQSCANVLHYREHEPSRIVEAQWDPQDGATFRARIEVDAFDRVGLLNDVTGIISSHQTNISRAEVVTGEDCGAKLKLELEIDNLRRLETVMREVGRLSDVRRVRRMKA